MCKAYGIPGKPNAFKIQVPGRVYNLESSEYPAKEWIHAINKEVENIA